MLRHMDIHLPLLADINFHVGVAEEACAEGSWATARTNLEKAEASFAELRTLWPDMDKSEQGLLAAMLKPLKLKYAAAVSKLPQLTVVSQGAAERDAESDIPPE